MVATHVFDVRALDGLFVHSPAHEVEPRIYRCFDGFDVRFRVGRRCEFEAFEFGDTFGDLLFRFFGLVYKALYLCGALLIGKATAQVGGCGCEVLTHSVDLCGYIPAACRERSGRDFRGCRGFEGGLRAGKLVGELPVFGR